MKKHVVSTYERAGRQVKSYTRGGKKPQKTAAKAGRVAPPAGAAAAAVYDIANDDVYAELQGIEVPVEQPMPEPVKDKEPATFAQIAVLAILVLVAAAIAVGAYVVIYGVLTKIYPGIPGALRALVPLGVEMIAAYVLHKLYERKQFVPAAIAAALVLGCGWIEVDAAREAPAAAAAQREGEVLRQQAADLAKQGQVQQQAAPDKDGTGRKGQLQFQQNQGAALTMQAGRDEEAKSIRQQQLANAKAVQAGEGRLSIELTLAGALGSGSVLPLLEALLLAISSRRRKAA